ncbi:hypothetical protein F5148DRAFT_251869 [Russula earlei]|uniref:Uncharacterized protein n=1 Tax=Russula earlei TaxID=71964 RepID=A0ACC0U3S0_9AGAM|nr:hypothetical protein F5148DRAFT_251869 [Russula earlei]
MHLPPVFAIFCLAVGIGPSFALPTSFTRDEYSVPNSRDDGPPEKQKRLRYFVRDTPIRLQKRQYPDEPIYGRVGAQIDGRGLQVIQAAPGAVIGAPRNGVLHDWSGVAGNVLHPPKRVLVNQRSLHQSEWDAVNTSKPFSCMTAPSMYLSELANVGQTLSITLSVMSMVNCLPGGQTRPLPMSRCGKCMRILGHQAD